MGRPHRIMHFIDSGGLYGAESVLLNLSGPMRDSGRYEPSVGCIVPSSGAPSDLYDAARDLGLAAEKVVIRNTMLPLDLPRAARRLQRLGIDLIHSHGYKPSVFGSVIRSLSGIEVMATCHLWFRPENAPLKMRLMVELEKVLYRRFRSIVAVSEPIRGVLLEAGVGGDRVHVIRNGVPTSPAATAGRGRDEVRRELGLRDDEKCILNAGRLTAQKAQDDILRTARILRDRGEAVRFLIIGEGPLRAELERQIASLELSDCVRLLGFRRDVGDLLGAADLFLLPSLDEGMPMGLLEAGARGLPVVSTAVGDIPKLVEHDRTGWIVPQSDPLACADAISGLIADGPRAAGLGQALRGKVEELYSVEAMYRQYDPVYSELLGRADR